MTSRCHARRVGAGLVRPAGKNYSVVLRTVGPRLRTRCGEEEVAPDSLNGDAG
jgi:hypothetical protein